MTTTERILDEDQSILYLNEKDAAKFLGMSAFTLRNWRNQKVGPIYFKVGNVIRYKASDLINFINQHTVGQNK